MSFLVKSTNCFSNTSISAIASPSAIGHHPQSIEWTLLTTSTPLDLFLLQFHPTPICQLICERSHQQDFGHGPRESPVESDLVGSRLSVMGSRCKGRADGTGTLDREVKQSLHAEKQASVPELRLSFASILPHSALVPTSQLVSQH